MESKKSKEQKRIMTNDEKLGLIRPRKILINIMIVCGKTSLIPQLMVGNYTISTSPR